jgi:hypothetical protein
VVDDAIELSGGDYRVQRAARAPYRVRPAEADLAEPVNACAESFELVAETSLEAEGELVREPVDASRCRASETRIVSIPP